MMPHQGRRLGPRWGAVYQRQQSIRSVARMPRPFGSLAPPSRPFARSPLRPIGYSEVSVVLYVTLADDLPSAVNQEELAELIVLVLQVDCPIPTSGGSGIGTPG